MLREREIERERRKEETEMACFAVLAALVLALSSCYFAHPLPAVTEETVQAVRCDVSNETVNISSTRLVVVGNCTYPEGRNRGFCDVKLNSAVSAGELVCSSSSQSNTDVQCFNDGNIVCHCRYREDFIYDEETCALYRLV